MPMRRLVAWQPIGTTLLAACGALAGSLWLTHAVRLDGVRLLLAQGAFYCALFLPLFLLAGGRRQVDLVMGWRHGKAAAVPP